MAGAVALCQPFYTPKVRENMNDYLFDLTFADELLESA